MILIVCVDDNKGMMFNHRRQSQDRVLRRHILDRVGDAKLWMNGYSAKMFEKDESEQVRKCLIVDERLQKENIVLQSQIPVAKTCFLIQPRLIQ